MEILDASYLEEYNFVMVERHVPQSMVLEILEAEQIETQEDIEDLLPPLFCPRVDLYALEEDGGIVYVPDYKAPTTFIDLSEGDEEDDICE